jgi:hypothetical protein
MNSPVETPSISLSPWKVAGLIVVIGIIGLIVYVVYTKGPTVQPPSYKSGFVGGRFEKSLVSLGFKDASGAEQKEGFYGGAARGAGIPDCLRSSAEGAELISMFHGKALEEGSKDLRELTQIVSKLSCLKKDLVSPAHIVEATRYQQFVTTHDIEPVAEVTGRCFAKVIPPRDLELIFDKWTERGDMLVRRLCTSYGLTSGQYDKADMLFKKVLRDVKDIARGACLQGEPSIAGKPGPRDPHPYEKPSLVELGTYTGYY